MAKKRGGKKAGRCGEAPEDPACIRDEPADQNGGDEDHFDSLIDGLYQKRAATRLHALNELVQLLGSNVLHEVCITRETTLSRLFLSSVRRGNGTEALVAARGLGLLVLTLGLEDCAERVWTETGDALIKVAGNKLKAAELRCGALDAYSVACFVAESDPHATLEAMAKLTCLWRTDSHAVRECAVRGWTLLTSTLSAGLMDEAFEDLVEKLTTLLEDPAVDVRRAASEAVALLHTFGLELESDDMEYGSDGESSVASNSTGLSRMSGIDSAMDRMRDLAGPKGQGKRKSKKDRAAMRSTFREVCSFVEDGIVAEAKIKLKGTMLVVNDLPGLVQLNFVRKILAGGFQTHLHNNELLHQIFQYTPGDGAAPRMTKSEKRMFRSPQSDATKLRTRVRRNDYDAKMQMMEGC